MIAATACSAASLVALGWVVPPSNQAFRMAATQNPAIARGANEFTLGELRRRIRSDREWGRDSIENAMSYHSRSALAAAPSVVVMWALLLLEHGARKRWLIGLAVFATFAAWLALTTAGRLAVFQGMLPPLGGAWVANLLFVGITLLLAATTILQEPRDDARQ